MIFLELIIFLSASFALYHYLTAHYNAPPNHCTKTRDPHVLQCTLEQGHRGPCFIEYQGVI